MLKKIIFIISVLFISKVSFAEINDGLSLFKPEVQPLVKQYFNNQNPDVLVKLLNTEFNKNFIEKTSDGKGIVATDLHFEFDSKDKEKLNQIYLFFKKEFKSKYKDYPVDISYLDYQFL